MVSLRLPATSVLAMTILAAAPRSGAAQQQPPRPDLEILAVSPPVSSPPGSSRSPLDRALAARDWARAEQLLVEAIERQPSTSLLKTLAGVFLMDRKPLNAAIALKKAEALAPLDEASRLQLALAYIAMKRGDWARPELTRLAQEHPSAAIYSYWLGRLDYDDGQYTSAIARLEQAAAQDPQLGRAFDNLGLCYEALNQPERAMAHYREAVRLTRLAADKSPWPVLNLGILLRTRGELAEAEALFREALVSDPQFARAHYQLGALLEQTGRIDEAVEALDHAAKADALYPEPHYALARIYRRQGRTAKADAALGVFERLKAPGGGARR
jgi:tetratricopeptide (TPR) repeat protein